MTTQEIVEQIDETLELFRVQHEKTTKISGGKARKLMGEIKKLTNDYRKASITENKNNKNEKIRTKKIN